MYVLALLLVPLVLIQVTATDPQVLFAVEIVNALIWLAFAAELVWFATRATSARGFFIDHWLDIGIVLLSPPLFVPPELASLRVLRVLRLVRLLALVGRVQRGTGRAMGRQGLAYIVVLVLFFVFIGGVSIHELEPERAPTVWDGMWWAIVTLTTVGYGDISPATFEGRVLAAFLMVSGLAVVGALAGSIGALFLGSERSEEVDPLVQMRRDIQEIREAVVRRRD